MPGTRQKRKVKNVMHEYKDGELKSGSGRKLKSRKQAIAIAMSIRSVEAAQKGQLSAKCECSSKRAGISLSR